MRTARRNSGDTWPSATQCWIFLGSRPFAIASFARSVMNAVADGFDLASVRTSGSVRYAYAEPRNRTPATPPMARPMYFAADVRRGRDGSGGRLGAGRLGVDPTLGQHGLQRAEQQDDQARRRARAHQADAPDLAGQRPEAAADLDAELLEQLLPHGRIVDAVRDADGVERPEAIGRGRQQREIHRREAVGKRPVVPLVAGPSRLEVLFLD